MTVEGGGSRAAPLLLLGGLVDLPVDARNLLDPPVAFEVGHVLDLFLRPVEVVGDVGYLLVELSEGVAYDPPGRSGSTSKFSWQRGQTAVTAAVPLPLIRL